MKLMVEVFDHAPADLTSGERLTLLVIAEWANDGTREARQTANWTIDTIVHRSGIKRTGLKAIFQGLARKGCEVRVPIKVDKNGKPVYAFEGKAMRFRIPEFSKWGGCDLSSVGRSQPPHSDQEGMPQHPRGEAVASQRGGHSLPLPLSPLKEPLKDLSLGERSSVPAPREPLAEDRERDDDASLPKSEPNPRRGFVINHGAPEHLADVVIRHIENANPNIGGLGWWITANRNSTLAVHVAKALAACDACDRCSGAGTVPGRSVYGDTLIEYDCPACTPLSPESIRDFMRTLANQPHCPHGYEGGDVPMPERGWMSCAACRNASGYVPVKPRTSDVQPRSGERGGYRASKVNHDEPGHRTAGWNARRQQHQAYQNPPAEEYDEWHTRRSLSARGQHVPYLDPEDLSVYDKPL